MPVRSPRSDGVAVTLCVLITFSLMAMWLVLYGLFFSQFQEQRVQHGLYARMRYELANETAPLSSPIKAGAPVALINAPIAKLHNAVIVQGTSAGDLEHGPAHRSDTVLPGQVGVSIIFGRAVTFGAPFAHLTSFRQGDKIMVTTGQGVSTYVVDDVRKAGDPIPAPIAAGGARLVLVSVIGQGYRSGWAPTQPVYVDATMTTNAQPAGSVEPAIASSQQELASDPQAWVPLVLLLQAFVVIAIAFVWSRARWGVAQAWLAGAPAVLATMWLVTETAARLLPNLL